MANVNDTKTGTETDKVKVQILAPIKLEDNKLHPRNEVLEMTMEKALALGRSVKIVTGLNVKAQVMVSHLRLDDEITHNKEEIVEIPMEKALSLGTSVKIISEVPPATTGIPTPAPAPTTASEPEIKKAEVTGKTAPIPSKKEEEEPSEDAEPDKPKRKR